MSKSALDFMVSTLNLSSHQWQESVTVLAQEAANYAFLYDQRVKEIEKIKANAQTAITDLQRERDELQAEVERLRVENAELRHERDKGQEDLQWANHMNENKVALVRDLIELALANNPYLLILYARTNKIGAIKAVRMARNLGLKEAKELVDDLMARYSC